MTRVEVSPNSSPSPSHTLPFDDSPPIVVTPEVAPAVEKNAEDAATTLVRLQTTQFAFNYVTNLRPKSPFDGKSGKVDFEQYLRKFEAAQKTPGLSPALRLAEFEYWWVGVSGLKVARFLLRDDEEVAIAEAIAMLKKEYGKRRTTADEMLEDLLLGEKVPQKDLVAVDKFVSSLEAIYYVALDTGRADEFEKKSLFESILVNKLPQFRHKWIVKWSRVEQENGPILCFLDFLEYLKTAIRIARNVSRCDAAAKKPKRVEENRSLGTRDSSTFGNQSINRGSISGREFPLLRPTYL